MYSLYNIIIYVKFIYNKKCIRFFIINNIIVIMSSSYLCKKCNYKTTRFTDLLRHMKKINKCMKKIDAYVYSDDQLIFLSLMPYINNIHTVNEEDIEFCKNTDILYDNLKELLNLIHEVDKDKLKKCKFCDEECCKILDLRKHIIQCFLKNKKKENDNNIKSIHGDKYNSDIDASNNHCYNSTITNSHNTNNNNSINNSNNNNNNSINIFLDVKPPVPFDQDWDISKISTHARAGILMNNLMYTSLLEEILKNDVNLNVIIDKKNESGMVYKNDIEKYIEMTSQDIVINTMEKLNKQLLQINKDAKDSCMKDCIDFTRRIITKKYIDYVNDINLQKNVSHCVSNIYDKKKDDAIKISQHIENKRTYKENGF